MICWPNRREAILQTLAVAALSAPSHSALAAIAAARGNEIDRLLKARVDAGEIPGVVAMAATQRTILYEGAFGVRCLGTQAKMSDDTVFRIASMVTMEAIRNTVSSDIFAWVPRQRTPKAPSYRIVLWVAAMATTPGISPASTRALRRRSISLPRAAAMAANAECEGALRAATASVCSMASRR